MDCGHHMCVGLGYCLRNPPKPNTATNPDHGFACRYCGLGRMIRRHETFHVCNHCGSGRHCVL